MSHDPGAIADWTIRPYLPDDLPMVSLLCRRCFPESPRWQGVHSWGEAWWTAVSEAGPDVVESWVVVSPEGCVVAACVLVVDEETWKRLRARRQGSWKSRLLSVLWCPKLTVCQLARSAYQMRRGVAAPLAVHNRTWLEMLAVSPDYQGRGLARRLLSLCEKRTSELRRKGICLRVDFDNCRARKVYEQWGFVLYGQWQSGARYVRVIADQETIRAAHMRAWRGRQVS